MKTIEETRMIAEKLEQYFAFKTGGEKMFLSKRGEEFYVQAMMSVGICDMPMNVYISEDGEWAFLALDLCVSCLPGCEQRLFTYCTRLCMDAEQYVQGTFRVHPDQALYFYVSIPTDYVLEDADYFLDALFYRSTEMLKRFYPTIQKLCAGRMLDYNDFCLSSFNCDHDIGNVKMSQRDDEKLFQLLEDFMVDIEDECISEDCYESISSLHLRNELFQACENKNVTLDVWAEDSCRVCISLELPLQKIPNTEPMLLDCFQKVYASPSWHQGTFCIEENGKVSLRMGLDAHVALRCPRLLHDLTEDGVQLIQIYYAMLNSIARGKLLQNISCGTPFYEMMDVQNGMQTFFDLNDDTDPKSEEYSGIFEEDESAMNQEETDEEDDRYILAWDNPFEMNKDDEDADEWFGGEEDFELDEEMWEELYKELEEDAEDEEEETERTEFTEQCGTLEMRTMEEIFGESRFI